MKWLYLGVIAAGMCSSVSNAQDTRDARYRLVAAADSAAVFVDEASIQRTGDQRTYWVLVVNVRPVTLPSGVVVSYRKVQNRDRCTTRGAQTLYQIAYGTDGQVLGTLSNPESVEPVIPGSTGELAFNYVCSGLIRNEVPLVSEQMAIEATRTPRD